MLMQNMPEQMHSLLILNEGLLFWSLWKVISVFIDARTVSKIQFLGDKFMPTLLQYVGPEEVPPFLGGTSSFVYSGADILTAVAGDSSAISVRESLFLPPPPETSLFYHRVNKN